MQFAGFKCEGKMKQEMQWLAVFDMEIEQARRDQTVVVIDVV